MKRNWIIKGIACAAGIALGIMARAQNNPIFRGGGGDGHFSVQTSVSSDNIFKGGNGDGWAAQQTNNTGVDIIFKGGSGDGWNSLQRPIVNVDTIYKGGNGDGWSSLQTVINKTDTIFHGGNGDGWSGIAKPVLNVDTIFKGGVGDGWASTYIPQGPVPVNFLYFQAKKEGNNASLLNWKTAQEINSAYYDVERSEDAVNFHYIGRVAAAGNSSTVREYYFTDNNPEKGMNYYRLKQVDADGHYIYTASRLVRFESMDAGTVRYFPNPTQGILNIDLPGSMRQQKIVINISNVAGLVMDQQKIEATNTQRLQVDLRRYAKGVYFIQVRSGTANSVQRVILQ